MSITVLDLDGVIVTDGNAAASFVRFRPVATGLSFLDREQVFANDWRHPGDILALQNHRKIKCAEVLVPNQILPSYIIGAYVSCEQSRAKLAKYCTRSEGNSGPPFILSGGTAMIRPCMGNILESEMQTLVNTVNCVGIMGKGLALEFKKHFPDMYRDYVVRCSEKQVRLGEPYLYRRLLPPWILNFPTKDHWRSVSRLSDIVEGLEYLEKHYQEWGITSLAVPALGCSNGQLEWRVVGPTLYRYLSRFDIPVELYAPYGTPEEEIDAAFLAQATASTSLNDTHKEKPSSRWPCRNSCRD